MTLKLLFSRLKGFWQLYAGASSNTGICVALSDARLVFVADFSDTRLAVRKPRANPVRVKNYNR